MMSLGFSTLLFVFYRSYDGTNAVQVCPKLVGRAYTYEEEDALLHAYDRLGRTLTEDETMAVLFSEALLG